MTLQVACVRVELGLLGPPGSQEHVFLGSLVHARGPPPPPPREEASLHGKSQTTMLGSAHWSPGWGGTQGQLGALSAHLPPQLPLLSAAPASFQFKRYKHGTCPSHFSVRSNKSPTVEIHVIALSGLGALRLCEILAQGRPQSHRHCSSHSVFLTVQGDTRFVQVFWTRVEKVACWLNRQQVTILRPNPFDQGGLLGRGGI